MYNEFTFPNGKIAKLLIDKGATTEDYLHILKWLHKRIAEKNWQRIEKEMNVEGKG